MDDVSITVNADDRKIVSVALEDSAKAFEAAALAGHPSKFVVETWAGNAAALHALARKIKPTAQ